MFRALNWNCAPVPFFFRVRRASRFLRHAAPLRRSRSRRLAADFLARSGLGSLGLAAVHFVRRAARARPEVTFDYCASFGDWADEIWNRHGSRYGLIAVRDRRVLNRLYPVERVNPGRNASPNASPFIRLVVQRRREPIGWAVVLATPMAQHKYFGDLKVGTIVDAFSAPEDARDIVACARQALVDHDVDLMVSNQSHAAWCDALRACGFLSAPTNFFFFASPALGQGFQPFDQYQATFHINRGDGDGPINL
jgi:hypothetical protein